jgi:hypothetical protein
VWRSGIWFGVSIFEIRTGHYQIRFVRKFHRSHCFDILFVSLFGNNTARMKEIMFTFRKCLALAILSLVVTGCSGGGNDAPPLAPVSGVVKLKGQPLENPVVTFFPEKGPSGIGVGNPNGEFTIKTNGQNGVAIGKCKVTVTSPTSGGSEIPPADGKEMEILKKPQLNAKYSNVDTTDLVVEVGPEGHASLQLDLD